MRKQLLTMIGAGFLSLTTIAQTQYVHQVIYLNEGQYDYTNQVQITPVSLGSYDAIAGSYSEFAVISGARFGSDVLIDGDFIYVAADSLLLKYDKNTLTLSDVATIEGIRKITIWNNQVLVTIGESGVSHNSYFRVFDKNTLDFIYELNTASGPIYSTEGVVVLNDTAYIAVNNSLLDWLNPKGLIGIVDLNAQTYMGEVDIAPAGTNPDNLMISGNYLYTLNNTDFTNSSITKLNTQDRTFMTTSLNAASGCGASVFADNRVFYHRYDYNSNWLDTNSTLNLYNTSNQSITTIYPNLMNVYGMADDEINNQIYITTSDFFSSGMAYVMDYSGALLDSFAVGVSPGNLALDVRDLIGVSETSAATAFKVHPNPSSSIVYIDAQSASGSYELVVTDVTGRQVYAEQINQAAKAIDIQSWPNGVYMFYINSSDGQMTHKLIKY